MDKFKQLEHLRFRLDTLYSLALLYLWTEYSADKPLDVKMLERYSTDCALHFEALRKELRGFGLFVSEGKK